MRAKDATPCWHCELRFPGCHAICLRYAAWQEARLPEKKRIITAAKTRRDVGCCQKRRIESLNKKRGIK